MANLELHNRKIWSTGNSHVITIPKDLLKYGVLNKEKKYDITLTEASDEE